MIILTLKKIFRGGKAIFWHGNGYTLLNRLYDPIGHRQLVFLSATGKRLAVLFMIESVVVGGVGNGRYYAPDIAGGQSWQIIALAHTRARERV